MVRDRGSPNRGPTFENRYRHNDEHSAIREINSDLTNVVGLDIINRADASQSVNRLNAVAYDSESEGATSLWRCLGYVNYISNV